LFHFSSL